MALLPPINRRKEEFFRPNVGIIVAHPSEPKVLWCRRRKGDFWQFPQGGVDRGESPLQAARRELYEETGLAKENVLHRAETKDWHKYRIPNKWRRRNFAGQKQRWFLYQLCAAEETIQLDVSRHPEFDQWQWVSYWYPLGQVVEFKAPVYRRILLELAPAFWALFDSDKLAQASFDSDESAHASGAKR